MKWVPLSAAPPLQDRIHSPDFDVHAWLSELEARFEKVEPHVQAFVAEDGRFDRLRRELAALERLYPDTAARPNLFGVMFGVKDILHVDGLPTMAGVVPPTDALAGPEAESISRMRAAGALVLGKTVTTEFGYFAPGPTRNPHHPDHTPGGSSSGSAAAVAAGLCDLAIGTQTIGSIIRPAAFCGVVGYKPTYTRISRVGMIPLAPSMDHVGTFTHSVSDLTLAASVLVHEWTPPGRVPMPVLGIPQGPYLECAGPEAQAHFYARIEALRRAGLTIKDVPAMPDYDRIRARHGLIVDGEAARVHERWFSQYVDQYHPTTRALVDRGRAISDDELIEARDAIGLFRDRLARLMADHGLDAWVTPSTPGPAPEGLAATGDPVMNLPWSQAGMPAVTLPAGQNDQGLPLGLQLVGRFGEDERLLAQAEKVEALLAESGS
jgi:Asp-tRNA(Asn)/Glu-tRNA(Gln) amidotransferase A subunit family amidase